MLLEALGEVADHGIGWLFLLFCGLLLLAAEIGYRAGLWASRTHSVSEGERTGVGFITAGMLGLLAFLLGISLSMAQGAHEKRREAILAEANAIGTAWLRSGLIAEELGDELRRKIRAYAGQRIAAIENARRLDDVGRLAEEAQPLANAIWADVERATKSRADAITGSLVAAVNEMFDRATDVRRHFATRVPRHVLRLLLWASILSVIAMGYHFAMTGRRQFFLSSVLIAMWAGAVVLIVDINRPGQGWVRVGAEPILWTVAGFGPAP